jgi:hypothetical protein
VDQANAHTCPSTSLVGACADLTDYDSWRVKRHGTAFGALPRLTRGAGHLRDLGTSDASVATVPGGRI